MREDMCVDDLEVMVSLIIENVRPSEKNVIVGVIYRPPNQNVNAFAGPNDIVKW